MQYIRDIPSSGIILFGSQAEKRLGVYCMILSAHELNRPVSLALSDIIPQGYM